MGPKGRVLHSTESLDADEEVKRSALSVFERDERQKLYARFGRLRTQIILAEEAERRRRRELAEKEVRQERTKLLVRHQMCDAETNDRDVIAHIEVRIFKDIQRAEEAHKRKITTLRNLQRKREKLAKMQRKENSGEQANSWRVELRSKIDAAKREFDLTAVEITRSEDRIVLERLQGMIDEHDYRKQQQKLKREKELEREREMELYRRQLVVEDKAGSDIGATEALGASGHGDGSQSPGRESTGSMDVVFVNSVFACLIQRVGRGMTVRRYLRLHKYGYISAAYDMPSPVLLSPGAGRKRREHDTSIPSSRKLPALPMQGQSTALLDTTADPNYDFRYSEGGAMPSSRAGKLQELLRLRRQALGVKAKDANPRLAPTVRDAAKTLNSEELQRSRKETLKQKVADRKRTKSPEEENYDNNDLETASEASTTVSELEARLTTNQTGGRLSPSASHSTMGNTQGGSSSKLRTKRTDLVEVDGKFVPMSKGALNLQRFRLNEERRHRVEAMEAACRVRTFQIYMDEQRLLHMISQRREQNVRNEMRVRIRRDKRRVANRKKEKDEEKERERSMYLRREAFERESVERHIALRQQYMDESRVAATSKTIQDVPGADRILGSMAVLNHSKKPKGGTGGSEVGSPSASPVADPEA